MKKWFSLTLLVALMLSALPLGVALTAEAQDEEPQEPTGPVAITLWGLNAYSAPAGEGEFLAVLEERGVYPILGKNADGTWWFVDYGEGQGWIVARDTELWGGDIDDIPVVTAAGHAAAAAGGATTMLPPTGLVAIPIVWRMNVRQSPSLGAAILGTVDGGGNSYDILGRNEDADWWLIDFDGGMGWLYSEGYARYLGGDISTVPVTDVEGSVGGVAYTPTTTAAMAATTTVVPTLPATGVFAIPTVSLLNVRQRPTTTSTLLGTVQSGNRYDVLGKDAEEEKWWLIAYGEGQGWIYAGFATTTGGDADLVPVTNAEGVVLIPGTTVVTTGEAPEVISLTEPLAPVVGTIVAIPLWDLNVRAAPTVFSDVLVIVEANSRYPLIGRSPDDLWWLIDYGEGQGWISVGYARYEYDGGGSDLDDVPIIE